MNIGGYFPLRTERERFELRINAGFFDDFGGNFSSDDNDRGFFESGQNVEVVERSFQSPGTTGAEIGKDSEFFRAKSRGELLAGQGIAGLVGAGLGIPGLSTLFSNIASRPVFATDAQGNRISVPGPQGGSGTAGGESFDRLALEQAIAQTGGATISGGGDNVAVTVNEQGQLVDNSGNIVNQQGQRVDANGRVLSESELAIQQATGITTAAAGQATEQLLGGQQTSLDLLQSAANQAKAENFLGAQQAGGFLTAGAAEGQGFLQNQADLGIGGIEQQLGITQGRLDPFTQAGTRALGSEEAFLGLSGPEAQQAAFAGFTESPGQQFLREQQEQALLRGSAAIGGLGGGRVRGALQEQAFGIASTRLDDQLNRLSQLSGRGQQSATQQGQFGQAAAGDIANIRSQLGGRQAGIATGTAANQANLATNLFGRQADIATGLGQSQVGVVQPTSVNLSNLLLGTGESQAGAVLGQQAVRTGDLNEQRRLAAQQQAQQSQQDAAFNQSLLGLAGTVAAPFISSFF